MTSSSDRASAVWPPSLNQAEQVLQIAISELGAGASDPAVLRLLTLIIDAEIRRGTTDPTALAHAAVDEVVLTAGGRVRPRLSS